MGAFLFAIGFISGVFFGVFTSCLLIIAGRYDDDEQ